MKLLLDLGNTRLKWALLDEQGLGPMQADTLENIAVLPRADSAVLASSCADPLKLTYLRNLLAVSGIVDVTLAGPPHSDEVLTLAYAEPSSLGVDRWLAMRAARRASDPGFGRAFIVASCGSALTVDAVDADGRHLGGCIAPGVTAMRRALFSAAPHLEGTRGVLQEFADSTINAVHSGPLLAAAALINRQHEALARRVNDVPRLLLTGGDAESLLSLLPADAQHMPDLVLRGMQTLND